jgi:signal transduction histidine kinase
MASVERMHGVSLNAEDQLIHILRTTLNPVDLACVYLIDGKSLQELACLKKDVGGSQSKQALEGILFAKLQHAEGQPVTLSESELQGTSLHSGLTLPLRLNDETIGALALFSQEPGYYTLDRVGGLEVVLSLVQTVVQNLVLGERLENANARIEKQQHDTIASRLSLLDAITDGVLVVLPQGDTAVVFSINTRFTTMFGITSTQAKNLTLDALVSALRIPRNIQQELIDKWKSVPTVSTQRQEGQFVVTGSAGMALDVQWYSGPVMQQDKVRGRIFIFHDATPENVAARLRAAWLSRVPHELRTPLTSISGFAQFILEETGDQLPDLAREYTEIILNSARHLNRVFTGMIEISRADAGELSLHQTDAHMPDVIIETVARLELQYKKQGIKVVMEIDDDLPHLNIDIDRVSQALTIVLNNALQCSPPSGIVRVSTKYATQYDDLPLSAPRDVIFPCTLVSVVDQGEGLTLEETQKVFEPFFRTKFARAKMMEGSGLGLTLARSFIDAHGGKIWAEPARQKGVDGGRFFIVLPQ